LALCTAAVLGAYAGEDDTPPVINQRVVTIQPAGDPGVTAVSQRGALITLDVTERPLKQVLDYLSTISNVNIRVVKEKDNKIPVTFRLENVTYRAVLDFIARKYGMIVDDRDLASSHIIYIDTPERVSMVFQRADIRDVINTIAIQSNANIVVGPEIQGEVSMRLENVPWNEALSIVVKTLDFVTVNEPNNTIRITSKDKIASQMEIRIFRLAYISPEGSSYTAVLTSEFVKQSGSKDVKDAGQSLIDVLSHVKTTAGSISFEKRANALVVRDTPNALDSMQSIIDKLDLAPKQVHVSVKLVELSDSDAERIGVNWNQGIQFALSPVSNWSSAFPFDVSNGISKSWLGDLAVGQGNRPVTDPLTKTIVPSLDIFPLRNAVGRGGGFSALTAGGGGGGAATIVADPRIALGSMGFRATTALFELFKTKTSGRVIQAPQLITLDNEEATIQVGELVRYAESFIAQTEGGGSVSGFREAGGSPIKLGLQLLIIPHVTGPENNVLMTVIPKTESFSLDRSGTGGAPAGFQRFIGPDGIQLDLPQTNQRIVVTKMMLRNGETGVIGGLRQEREDLAEVKVPVFGEIPVLGRLFKHRSRSDSGSNLMVFVTPTIIDLHATDDIRRELDRLRQEYAKPFSEFDVETSTSEVTK
jgi:type IV pilus assembly protein PilQ